MMYLFCSSFAFEVVILLGNEQLQSLCPFFDVAHTWLTNEHVGKNTNFPSKRIHPKP